MAAETTAPEAAKSEVQAQYFVGLPHLLDVVALYEAVGDPLSVYPMHYFRFFRGQHRLSVWFISPAGICYYWHKRVGHEKDHAEALMSRIADYLTIENDYLCVQGLVDHPRDLDLVEGCLPVWLFEPGDKAK